MPLTPWLLGHGPACRLRLQVLKLKLRQSCLGPLFHVRDLVGRGAVRRLIMPKGPVLQLVQRGSKRPG